MSGQVGRAGGPRWRRAWSRGLFFTGVQPTTEKKSRLVVYSGTHTRLSPGLKQQQTVAVAAARQGGILVSADSMDVGGSITSMRMMFFFRIYLDHWKQSGNSKNCI